jgi:hypothetical protein
MTIPVCVRQQTSLFPANCSRAHESHGPPRYAAFRFHRPGLRPRPPPPPFYPRFATFIHFSTANLCLSPSLRQPSCEFHLPNLYPVLYPTVLQFKFIEKRTQDKKVLAIIIQLQLSTLKHTVNLGLVSIKYKKPQGTN